MRIIFQHGFICKNKVIFLKSKNKVMSHIDLRKLLTQKSLHTEFFRYTSMYVSLEPHPKIPIMHCNYLIELRPRIPQSVPTCCRSPAGLRCLIFWQICFATTGGILNALKQLTVPNHQHALAASIPAENDAFSTGL
jgi:hypothetical protein